MKKRVAAFCSHGGSNFAAIADAAARGEVPLEVVLMIHNNRRAGAKEKAALRGISTAWVPRKSFASDDDYSDRLIGLLDEHRVDIVALAGFMQLVPVPVIQRFAGRITNIHPALLPFFGGRGYYGQRGHQAVFDSGMKVSGPTVHLVDAEYEHGPTWAQEPRRLDGCRPAAVVAARVLAEEHKLYPRALGLLAADRFAIEGQRVVLLSAESKS